MTENSNTPERIALDGAAATVRQQTTGHHGVRALWSNMKVFYIAMFASFVGFALFATYYFHPKFIDIDEL
jgi:nitrate/nitrite transporter NarK